MQTEDRTSVVRLDGRMTIPTKIREALHLRAGSPLVVSLKDGAIVVRPWRGDPEEAEPKS